VKKSVLFRALQQEIRRHDFNYFVHEPPSIAQGGRGVVVPGWADDVMPALIERLSAKAE
jgi:hypothetical protein